MPVGAGQARLDRPPAGDEREGQGEEAPGLVEVRVKDRLQCLAVKRGQAHRHDRHPGGSAEDLPGHQEEPHGGKRQQEGGQDRQDLPGAQSRDTGDSRVGVVDRVLGLPRGLHLVDRLRDVRARRIGVLEKLGHTRGHVGIGPLADGGGVVLDQDQRDERHEQHRHGEIHRPAQRPELDAGPAATPDRQQAEPDTGHQDQGQRNRKRDRGEPQDRQPESGRAGAGGQHPQGLVAAQRSGQEQPDQTEAADAENDDRGSERSENVGQRVQGTVARRGIEVPGQRDQRDQHTSGQQPLAPGRRETAGQSVWRRASFTTRPRNTGFPSR